MEQSIYTYCFKDYDSGNRGWGFYSFSDGMAAYFHRAPELQTMADGRNYCVPSNSEVWKVNPITDYDRDIVQEAQSIAQYHPQRFSYQKLEISHEETAVFVFGKNLGREIVSEGRAGNKLVYTLVGSMREVLDYPCFYGDNAFFQNKLTRSYFVNGNRDSRAAALPPVSLIAGKRVTRESVHAFLQADPNRTEYLASLFYALLQERSGGNRPILICDKKENIIFWIAAVTLLFPLEIAKNISFNTYDGLGETSVPQIPAQMTLCGVYSPTVNGAPESHATNYDAGAFQNRKDVVLFD
ncbi:GAP1-M domain-containing protein, partial [Ruminococcus sp.]